MKIRNRNAAWGILAAALAVSFVLSAWPGIVVAGEVNEIPVTEPGTRADDTVNYTQMALDFVRESYPDRELEMVTNDTRVPYPETGYSYAHIKINIIPGTNRPEDTVIVSIRHDTLHIEFGYDQYWNDYQEFLASLPAYYRKMSSESRTAIMQKFGYYPDISDPVAETYLTNFTIRFHPENQAKVESYLKELGLDYIIRSSPYYDTYIISHMSLKECLLIGNQSYVRGTDVYKLISAWPGDYPTHDETDAALKTTVIVAIIAVTAIVGALAFIGVRRRNHLKSEMKEEVGEEHVEKGKE